MIKIGKNRLVFSATLLIPKSSSTNIEFGEDGWSVKANLSFNDSASTAAVQIKALEDGVSFTFDQWNEPLGQATVEPTLFANLTNGSALYLMASNFRIGDTNQLLIQVLIGNKK